MQRIAALLTCHNRREATLACLDSLQAAAAMVPGLSMQTFLTDDGSSDGTADAVRARHPATHIVEGTGALYWTGGMVLAWEAALATGGAFDGFLLLNDDTVLDTGALKTLIETASQVSPVSIVVGAIRDPNSGLVSYGGVRRTSPWHPGRTERLPLSDRPQDADTFNGNCVLVPAICVERIGILDPLFTHAIGDFDYGLRAREAGIRIVVAPGSQGVCPRNGIAGTWLDGDLPIRKRLLLLNSPKGLAYGEWREFLHRHGAPFPCLLAAVPLLAVLAGWRARSYPGR